MFIFLEKNEPKNRAGPSTIRKAHNKQAQAPVGEPVEPTG